MIRFDSDTDTNGRLHNSIITKLLHRQIISTMHETKWMWDNFESALLCSQKQSDLFATRLKLSGYLSALLVGGGLLCRVLSEEILKLDLSQKWALVQNQNRSVLFLAMCCMEKRGCFFKEKIQFSLLRRLNAVCWGQESRIHPMLQCQTLCSVTHYLSFRMTGSWPNLTEMMFRVFFALGLSLRIYSNQENRDIVDCRWVPLNSKLTKLVKYWKIRKNTLD